MSAEPIATTVLNALIAYDSLTGELTWLHRSHDSGAFNSKFAGKVAGSVKSNAYGYRQRNIRITIDGNKAVTLNASRVAWQLFYGEEPSHEIDHIDGNGLNNRINNLRCVPRCINMQNKSKYRSNTSGITGVSWHKQRGKWAAQACIGGKNRHLGLFETKEEAAKRVMEARMLAGYTARHGTDSPYSGGNESSSTYTLSE
ncbi:HNH endonuclease [Pseudomonas sp. NPDC077408]|uniref:HNH endonuclease n=1 Tax=Streptomyces parvus TaxID=66428 RepID=UPI003710C0C1